MKNTLKTKILTLAFCGWAMCSFAQTLPSVTWAVQQGGTNAEVGAAITTDAVGNVYTTGVFSGTADLDPGPGTFNVTSAGAGDAYISKLDANGNFIWGKSIGGSSQENPFGIATDAVGNVIVCGGFVNTVDFDPGAGTFNLTSTAGSTDGFVLKLDASGNFAWAFSLGNTMVEAVYGVTTDLAGNVYAVGNFTGTTDFDPSAGTNDITATGGEDGFVAKYTPAGALTWARKLGTTGADRLLGIDVRANGFVYTAGYVSGTMAASDWNTLYPFPIPGQGGNDGIVWQLSASGVPSGGALVNTGGEDQVTAVVVDEVNNKLIAAGHYSGAIPTYGLTYTGATDICLIKFNLSNNNSLTTIRYAHGFGNTLSQLSNSLDIDAAGNVYWGGTTAGVGVDFDPSGNVHQLNSAGANDGFLASYDSTGAMRFAFTIGNSSQDFVGYTLKSQNTNLYVTGGFLGALDFDPSVGTTSLTPAGSFDAYAVKYNTCVTPPMPTNTTPSASQTICAGNSTSLSVSGLSNGQLSWYSASSGGTYLGSGSTFVTPVLSSTTTYYAQDSTCTGSARAAVTVNVNQGPASLSYSASSSSVCQGNAVILTGSGASSYAWSGGIFNATAFFPTATTTYTLTGTAANGCTATTTATITVLPRQPLTANASATSICLGDSLTLQGAGGQNYFWNNAVTNNVTFAPATAGVFNYIVNGDGLNNCPATPDTVAVTVTLAATPELDILYTPLALTGFSDDIVANGNDYLTSSTTSVDADVDGCRFIDVTYTQFGTPTRYLPTGGNFYSEEPSTPNLPFQFASYTANNSLTLQTGNMSGTLTLDTPTSMDAFYLLATGGGGSSTLNGVINFTDGTTQAISNLSITDWFNGANAAIKGTGRYYNNALGFQLPTDTNPRLYQFLVSISAANQNKYVQSVSFTRLNAGVMKAQLMGMTAVGSASRYCVEDSATVADLYANGSNLQWYAAATGGAPLATNTALVDGTTYYAAQLLNGCESAGRLAVQVIVTNPTRSVTHTACGSYTWPENNQTYTASGTYTHTVVNAFACDSVITLNLTIDPSPTVTITASNTAVCAGTAVTLSGNGASTYTWTGGVNDGQAFVPTATATYTVTGTAANGCTATATETVVVNTPPSADPASTNSACTAPTGSASVINVVGDGPFSYAWTGSASTTTTTASNVGAGVYVCTITDVNGCATPVTVIVNATNAPTVTLQSQTDVTCYGGTDGAATVNVSGGSSPYSYAWSSSSTSNAISNVSAGSYTCTVSDASSCEAFLVVTIAQPAALDSTISISGMTFTSNETTAGVTYQWVNCGQGNAPIAGQTNASFTPTQPGSYAVVVTLGACSVTSACETITGTPSNGPENTVSVYPNPNNGQFMVTSSEDGVLEAYSLAGQLLLRQEISQGTTPVSLGGQAQGTYLIRIICGENTTHKRIIIQ